jgi:hypothetical protein
MRCPLSLGVGGRSGSSSGRDGNDPIAVDIVLMLIFGKPNFCTDGVRAKSPCTGCCDAPPCCEFDRGLDATFAFAFVFAFVVVVGLVPEVGVPPLLDWLSLLFVFAVKFLIGRVRANPFFAAVTFESFLVASVAVVVF